MDLGLAGRTAVVTGGSKGIGLAVTRRLLAEGVRVVTGSRTITPELAATDATAVTVDLRTQDGADRLMAAAHEAFDRLDILVNNVGNGDTDEITRGVFTDLLDHPDSAWQQCFDLHFYSALRMTRLALPSLLAAGGTIVNLSSVAGRVPGEGAYDYNCAKAALNALTKYVAERYGPEGVRALTVSPGAALSRVWADEDGFAGRIAADRGLTLAEYHREFIADHRISTGRLTEPDDVARLVTFLASPSNLTGTDVVIDGGSIKTI